MSEGMRDRLESSYVKYGWIPEQKAVFEKFMKERYANYRNPENTLRSYLDLLNQVILKVKKPFSEMGYEDFVPLLEECSCRGQIRSLLVKHL